MKIKPLRPGDGIALIAPSSPFDLDAYRHTSCMLGERGYRIYPGRFVSERRGYLAGTDVERTEDILSAVLNSEVSAIFTIRGGFGSGRLLPWIPFSLFKTHRKIFLGYSDTTFLHLAFQAKTGWVTFHGPNLLDCQANPQTLDEVLAALSGNEPFAWNFNPAHVIQHGSARGPLLGGNLTCLVHLIGTPFIPDFRGAILFLEDHGEAPYRIDRLLNHLKLAGILDQIKGVVLGGFENCGETETIHNIFMDYLIHHSIPVVAGLPFGHRTPNQVLPLGIHFHLDTWTKTLQALDHPFTDEENPG